MSGVPQAFTRLHTVELANPVLDGRLYYSATDRSGRFSALTSDNGDVVVHDERIVTDTLFNAFFERHWVEFTSIRTVRFSIKTTGFGKVTLLRKAPVNAVPVVLAAARFAGNQTDTSIDITLDALSILQLGRLWVEIAFEGPGGRIHGCAWMTPERPLRRVKLHLIICTFNKPAATLANLATLLNIVPELGNALRIHVVDQGTERIRNHSNYLSRDKHAFENYVDIIEQDNFGGTGGFTRGMIAAKEAGATDVLLLDDDIVIEPRALERVIGLLRFATGPRVVGGHMLDLYNPSRLIAHAEVFDYGYGGSTRLEPHDLDCAHSQALDALAEPRVGTYNAWWFCCIPVSYLDEHGWPLPFFIRADDAEFGTRLTNAGCPLVQMPGLAVWHEPFYAKSSSWMASYSFRNDLILATLRLPSIKNFRGRLWQSFWWAITAYKYDLATAFVHGLESFAKGPDYVFNDIRANHKALLDDIRQSAPKVERFAGFKFVDAAPQDRFNRRMPMIVRNLLTVWWNYIAFDRKGRVARRILLPEDQHAACVYGDSVVAVWHRHEHRVLTYHKDRQKAWHLTLRFSRAIRHWLKNADRLHNAYRQAAPLEAHLERWRRRLEMSEGMSEDVEAVAPEPTGKRATTSVSA